MTTSYLKNTIGLLVLGLLLTVCATGCGAGMMQASSGTQFELNRAQEINDEDIRKAYEARPQLPTKFRVAYFSFDSQKAKDIGTMLQSVPGVTSVYEIPRSLVTGERKYQQNNMGYHQDTPVISMKKLRLLAARSQSDILYIFDYGAQKGGVNGWFGLVPLILPIFFVPMVDSSAESYLESFMIDIRNGYLYHHESLELKGGNPQTTIYGKSSTSYIEEQWGELLKRTGTRLGEVIATEHARPPTTTATTTMTNKPEMPAASGNLVSPCEPKPTPTPPTTSPKAAPTL
jgi:hypothetical protein